jgi:hypothetical protein
MLKAIVVVVAILNNQVWLDYYKISYKKINQVVVVAVIEHSSSPLILLTSVVSDPKVFLDPTREIKK